MKFKNKKIKCPKCGHEWITKSESQMLICAYCGKRIKRNVNEEVNDDSL